MEKTKQKRATRQEAMADAAEANIRLYVDRLYGALMQTGMYSTHFSAKPRSSYALKFQADGR